MAIAITPDQQALQASLRDWAKQAAPLAAVRRMEHDDAAPVSYLTDLAALGVFSIAVPEDAGGAGGTLADLAAALEQLAVALVPGPVLPTALAAVLAGPQLPALTISALTDSQATAAVALDPGTLTGTRHPDGTLHVTGRTGPVLGAGTTSHLLLACATGQGEIWFWLRRRRRHPDPLPARRLLPLPGRRHPDRQRGPGNPDPDRPDYPTRPRPGRHLVRRGGRGRGRLVQRHRRRLRQDPPAVRPRHRRVPGGQAPVRHHGLPGRTRRRAGLGRGPRRR